MPEAKLTTTELLTQYSSQLTNDLEQNVQEQDQVRSEIETLKARLLSLQHDHTVLATMQQALQSGIPLQQVPMSTPVQGYDLPTVSAPGTSRRKQQTPTLVALIRAYLAEQSEPCSAAEIATALSEAHPDRVIKTTVVRTTLEGLVARSSAERLKQGHSVFYTSLETDRGTDPEGTDTREGTLTARSSADD
ncbi:hypothetical protein [Streptomyces brasiliensis]|uniref:Regulatory protein n=1 Tax=Streptomyces brasiliensis TaxID=1954 RepID=A0A917KT89_9ACTN|nr:hypothetical protein [Streptomyces brasiliensis]GGJ28914.1 hypothetical protein GCM10010121_045280 [Streptomyces brasiliensis]